MTSTNRPPSFENSQKLFSTLREKCWGIPVVEFDGTFTMAKDPLVTDKERVQMLIHEVWKVTGSHFWYVTKIAHEYRALTQNDRV